MLKDALDRVVELARMSPMPTVVELAKEPPHRYGLAENGKLQIIDAAPLPRNHKLLSLEAVADWAVRFLTAAEGPCVIWYSRKAVAVVEDLYRRDRGTYELRLSHPLLKLMALERQGAGMTQKAMVKFLRVDMAGCLGAAGNFLEQVRKVVFRTCGESAGLVQHGKASLGKSIMAELQGAEAVPELVVFDVPCFDNLYLPSQQVAVAVDIDAATETFSLTPLPGTIELALRAGEERIACRVAELLGEHMGGGVELSYGET
jgi:hypothetical protein